MMNGPVGSGVPNQFPLAGNHQTFQEVRSMLNLNLNLEMSRLKLIEVVRDNRRKHAVQFNKNVTLYREKQRDWLECQLKQLDKKNPRVERNMNFPAPQHYLSNYDMALKMLSASEDEKIKLDQATYSSLVLDDWASGGINQYPLAINTPLDRTYSMAADDIVEVEVE